MCGTCGFAGQGTRDDLKRMTDRLTHRGPDADGFYVADDRPVYFGHRRLSIVDLTGGGQPMSTSDGDLTVTFNGEIYNQYELRHQLESVGYKFVTDHSDTEVLLHGWREWGDALPGKMNGMWAFAIYDRRQGVLFLSRDRFGKKPLYYTLQNGLFAFGSEIFSLLEHPSVSAELDPLSLQKLFAYSWIPARAPSTVRFSGCPADAI